MNPATTAMNMAVDTTSAMAMATAMAMETEKAIGNTGITGIIRIMATTMATMVVDMMITG